MLELTAAVNKLPKASDKALFPDLVLRHVIDNYGEELPHPLIFKVSFNGKRTFVGVREFTAQENSIELPDIIANRLAVKVGDVVKVEFADSIPKGTFLKLKPLQFYPEIHNWKYYLESHLTKYYTVLSKDDSLDIEGHEVVVEDISSDTVLIIDTDLVLDVVPLNDIMAHQQLNFGVDNSESIEMGQKVLDVVPFNSSESKVKVLKLDLLTMKGGVDIILQSSDLVNSDLIIGNDKLITLENFQFSTMDQDSSDTKEIIIPPGYVQELSDACTYDIDQGFDIDETNHWLYIVPFTWETADKLTVTIQRPGKRKVLADTPEIQSDPDTIECSNCNKPISKQQYQLHEAFCIRNNVKCELCGETFLKSIPSSHWHCSFCSQHSDSSLFRFKHEKLNHQPFSCEKCGDSVRYNTFIELVTQHKATVCPHKLHECKFCHLVLEQEEATYLDKFENLTHHENSCGNKTDECLKCHKLIKRKDFRKHFKIHQIATQDKMESFRITFRKCANHNCVNEVSGLNDLQLCDLCFGPLYSQLLDPTRSKLQARIERKYVLQLTKGCGSPNCTNSECKQNISEAMGMKQVLARVKQLMLHISQLPMNQNGVEPNQFWFCVTELMSRKLESFTQLLPVFGEDLVLQGLHSTSDQESLVPWLESHSC